MLTLLALLALSGCPATEAPAPAPDAGTPAPPPPPADPSQAIKDALLAGRYAEALTAGEAALGPHATDDVYWDLVEVAAIRGKQAGAFLDRLQANEAIGGRADRHFALRASLAREANRPMDLLAAARALQDVSPGDSAAFTLMAVQLGATVPPEAPPATVALVAAAAAPDKPLDPILDTLTGDRAAIARANLLVARGDRAGAAAVLAAVNPPSLLLAEEVAALKARLGTDADAAWTDAEAGATRAVAGADLVGAAEIYTAALPVAAGGFRADAVADAAAKLRAVAAEKKNKAAEAEAAAVQAEAALRAGLPLVAREAATLASQTAATKARGQWTLAMAAGLLGDVAGVEAAATGLPGVRVKAVADLARAMHGDDPALPSPGITGADGAVQALVGAGWLDQPAAAAAAAAAQAGDAPDLLRWAQAWSTSGPIPAADPAPSALVAENTVRTYTSGGAPVALSDGTHPNAAAWNVVLTNTGEPPAGAGLGSWPRFRASVQKGDITQAGLDLAHVAAASREWRRGPWRPVLRMDEVDPAALVTDLAPAVAGKDPAPIVAVVHGWEHRNQARDRLWSIGVSPVGGAVKPEVRDAVWAAEARVRVRELAWLSGRGEWPADDTKALAEAEEKAGLKAQKLLTLKDLSGMSDTTAIWSFLPRRDGVELLTVAGARTSIHLLPATFSGELSAYVGQLAAGNAAVSAGDRLRERAIDPAAEATLGVGTYHLVGPDVLGAFPMDALPEQSDGIRFLMAIRNVLHHATFEDLLPGEEPIEGSFTASIVAVVPEKEDAQELKSLFPDAVVLASKDATVEAWKKAAATARFLHFGRMDALPDGGFALPSGEKLYLGDIAATPLLARTAVVAAEGDARVAEARAMALRAGGVRDVLVTRWARDRAFHDDILLRFWDRSNRRYNAIRSFAEARNEAIKEKPEAGPPPWWGGYLLTSRK